MKENNKLSVKQRFADAVDKVKSASVGLLTFLGFVVVPTMVVFFYLLLFHSPMYETESKFAVRSSSDMPISVDFASLLFNPMNASSQDIRLVNEFIASPTIYERLDKDLKLTAHYSDKKNDIYSRLYGHPTLQEKKEFWEEVSSTSFDPDSGVLTFTVRAYSPKMAKDISDLVLRFSEELVNQMNERAREDTLALARREVQLAQNKVAQTQAALSAFREVHEDIDLKGTASGLQSLILELEGERAKVQAQIKELEGYMKEDAPAILGLRKKAAAIDEQLSVEKKRLTRLDSDKSLNTQISEFEKLTLEHEFAQKQLVSAMSALESARVQVLSKSRYVVSITNAETPDESTYPKPIVFSLIFGVGMSLVYALGYLVVVSIKEHIGY